VGVFRDASLDAVRAISDEARLDTVQLHGDESPEFCARVERPVLKRFAVDATTSAERLLARLADYDVAGHLLDPGAGSGTPFPWKLARGLGPRVFVAGGLTADNVADALRAARPYGVDVSFGVEERPGMKNLRRIRAFMEAVRNADAHAIA
jgi:phosphoribosylanthranilate isomerase